MNKQCAVEGCEDTRNMARGHCNKHYQRLLRHGNPLMGRPLLKTTAGGFEERTEWQEDCLVWIGTIGTGGYGQFKIGRANVPSHRYAYEQAHGPIPAGFDIDHMCHNRACCNVEHLRAVTRKQNLENRKGARKGSRSGHRNVTWRASKGKWLVKIMHFGEVIAGGHYPLYETHVAAYHARNLRNDHFTHNDLDRTN